LIHLQGSITVSPGSFRNGTPGPAGSRIEHYILDLAQIISVGIFHRRIYDPAQIPVRGRRNGPAQLPLQ